MTSTDEALVIAVMNELMALRDEHDLEQLCRRDPKAAQRLAHGAVADAVREGRLVRPERCLRCGRAPGRDRRGRELVQFHHDRGYLPEAWLVGVWLCPSCHRRAHVG